MLLRRGWFTWLVMIAAGLVVMAGCIAQKDPTAQQYQDLPPIIEGGTIGGVHDFGGIQTAIVAAEAFSRSPRGFGRLRLSISSTNTTLIRAQNPDLSIRCDESNRGGDWFAGSTWEPNGLIDGGDVLEGQTYLGFPAKTSDARFGVATCTNASLELVGSRGTGELRSLVVRIPIPADVVANALKAPIGPGLPLQVSTS